MKIVGILGGMGPAATIDFMARMLAVTGAGSDQEHVRMIVDQNPQVPDRNAAVAGTGPSPAPVLAQMARGLVRAGADVLAMPCNAAHAFAGAVRAAVDVPFVDMIAATADAVMAAVPDVRRVGVLGSTGCLDAGLYQTALAARGVEAIVPEGAVRDRFMELLYRIKAGETGPEMRAAMTEVADMLLRDGAEVIMAGCTEVPLVLSEDEVPVPLVNSTDALVAAVVRAAQGG